jgi:hypothetical protein
VNAATLTESFIKQQPRENSGSNTSNAYDFQKNWSLSLLLERHSAGNDYLIILDYHDDIVVFDSEKNAKNAEFYQVKTNTKRHWTPNNLLARDRAKAGLSIIGKIYENLHKFACHTKSLNFVSNVPCKFTFLDPDQCGGNKDVICGEELSQSLKDEFIKAIKEEHGTVEERFEQLMFFHVTDLSIRGHSDQVIGKVAKFLDEHFPDKKCKPVPIYQALFSEISRKTDYGRDLSKYLDCLKKKSIGKSYFDGILKSISVRRDFVELWRTVETTLLSEGFDAVEIRQVRNAWDQLEIDLLDANNLQLQRAYSITKQEVALLYNNGGGVRTLKDILMKMHEPMKERFNALPYPYSDMFITAMILAAFYEE